MKSDNCPQLSGLEHFFAELSSEKRISLSNPIYGIEELPFGFS
jgi:hypothetical protein